MELHLGLRPFILKIVQNFSSTAHKLKIKTSFHAARLIYFVAHLTLNGQRHIIDDVNNFEALKNC